MSGERERTTGARGAPAPSWPSPATAAGHIVVGDLLAYRRRRLDIH